MHVTLIRHFSEAVLITLLSFGTCEIHTRYSHGCSNLWAATQKIWAGNNASSQMLMETPTVICLLHTPYQIPGRSEPVRYDLVPQICNEL